VRIMRPCFTAIALVLMPLSALSQQGATKPVIEAVQEQKVPEAPPPPPPQNTPPPSDTSSYIIGPEDSLQITVWKEPGISGTLPVRPDGMISLPLVGDLNASGSTPMELSKAIEARLGKMIKNPNVNVAVLTVHPKQVFLLGEVLHVGPIVLVPGMSPLQAISAAGGLTPYANAKKIYILRATKAGGQEKQKIPFDYRKAIKDGNQQGVVLLPGDTIVIP
jgi:polysaccharide biosynthesis/export protein